MATEMETQHTFTAAVRGFHFYRRYWQPQEIEKLLCLHESGNLFERFAIKTVKEDGETVGHLPREVSRVTKYFLDRGITMHCELSSMHYRRSPLVQGGLEIQCQVVFKSPKTLLHSQLTERYVGLVNELYLERDEETCVGGSIFNFVMTLPPTLSRDPSRRKKKKISAAPPSPRDIRVMLAEPPRRKRKDSDSSPKDSPQDIIIID